MTISPRIRMMLLSLTLLAPLAGCTGDSNEKGDNGGSIITPKPSTVQDANTAGSSKSALPEAEKSAVGKDADPSPR